MMEENIQFIKASKKVKHLQWLLMFLQIERSLVSSDSRVLEELLLSNSVASACHPCLTHDAQGSLAVFSSSNPPAPCCLQVIVQPTPSAVNAPPASTSFLFNQPVLSLRE